DCDIMMIQEPYMQPSNTLTSASHAWRVVYPTKHHDWHAKGKTSRAITLVSVKLNTEHWEQVDIDTPDTVIIKLRTVMGDVFIINTY
ncbi:hypothetical protein BDW22DRAFT_1296905, partial [Trametopsis cervina]